MVRPVPERFRTSVDTLKSSTRPIYLDLALCGFSIQSISAFLCSCLYVYALFLFEAFCNVSSFTRCHINKVTAFYFNEMKHAYGKHAYGIIFD